MPMLDFIQFYDDNPKIIVLTVGNRNTSVTYDIAGYVIHTALIKTIPFK